jgi:quinol monooxygenase YgiN
VRADEASDAAIYLVSYIEVTPSSQGETMALLRQYREASRKEEGNVRLEVLQQSSRQNHCTIVEIWQDEKARTAHVMAGHTRQFREKFQPLSGSLYDERLYTALD